MHYFTYRCSFFVILLTGSIHCFPDKDYILEFSPKTIQLSQKNPIIKELCTLHDWDLVNNHISKSYINYCEKELISGIQKGELSQQDVCYVLNDCRCILQQEIKIDKIVYLIIAMGVEIGLGLYLRNTDKKDFGAFTELLDVLHGVSFLITGHVCAESIRTTRECAIFSIDFYEELLKRVEKYNQNYSNASKE